MAFLYITEAIMFNTTCCYITKAIHIFFLTESTDHIPHIFFRYIPCSLSTNSLVILFADDTSLIVNEPCLINFERNLNINFRIINKWFDSNLLSLNLDKTCYMQFITKNKSLNNINTEHDIKNMKQVNVTKFLGITIDNTPSWK